MSIFHSVIDYFIIQTVPSASESFVTNCKKTVLGYKQFKKFLAVLIAIQIYL